jgi:hypothetical protein
MLRILDPSGPKTTAQRDPGNVSDETPSAKGDNAE